MTKKVHIPDWRAHEGVALGEARKYIPLGATLWCSHHGQGNWQGHFKPFRRISRSWRKHGGSNNALQIVLRSLWGGFAEKWGLQPEDVVTGLLE